MRNSKISKNSLSGTKFFPVFSPGKHSDTKFHPYHGNLIAKIQELPEAPQNSKASYQANWDPNKKQT